MIEPEHTAETNTTKAIITQLKKLKKKRSIINDWTRGPEYISLWLILGGKETNNQSF